jgi:hypothetical protein
MRYITCIFLSIKAPFNGNSSCGSHCTQPSDEDWHRLIYLDSRNKAPNHNKSHQWGPQIAPSAHLWIHEDLHISILGHAEDDEVYWGPSSVNKLRYICCSLILRLSARDINPFLFLDDRSTFHLPILHSRCFPCFLFPAWWGPFLNTIQKNLVSQHCGAPENEDFAPKPQLLIITVAAKLFEMRTSLRTSSGHIINPPNVRCEAPDIIMRASIVAK